MGMKETQKSIYDWCHDTFPRYVGLRGRAVAVVEEAIELALAAGVTPEVIRAAVEVPIKKEAMRDMEERNRPFGIRKDGEEVADVMLCVYAYAEEAGLDAHVELDKKMEENRSRPVEYYEMKTAAKEALGYILPGSSRKC